MTNVWSTNKTPNPRTEDGRQSSYWWCRQWPTKQPKSKGSDQRAMTLRMVTRCSMKLKMTADYASPLAKHPEFCMIQRHAGEEHNHDLNVSDAFMINRRIKEVAAGQMSMGYKAHEVHDANTSSNAVGRQITWHSLG